MGPEDCRLLLPLQHFKYYILTADGTIAIKAKTYLPSKGIYTIYVDRYDFVHRNDGPAFSQYESYYNHGKLHRLDGPACIIDFRRVENLYAINGIQFKDKEEYDNFLSTVNKENIEDVLSIGELF